MKINMWKLIAIIVIAGLLTIACDDGITTSVPTVTLIPDSVTINDCNLTQTVNVGGTATGTMTLNTIALPAGVTATVSDATITVTGVRPTTDNGSIDNLSIVGVIREGVTQNLTVIINLTTTWDPSAPTVTLDPDSVSINNDNLKQTVSVGGTAIGTITLNTSALPAEVSAIVSGTTITVTGIRPTVEGGSIDDSYTVVVTREGVTHNLTVAVNLTTTCDPSAPTVTLDPANVTINNDSLTQAVNVGGTETGTVTINTAALPAEVTAIVSETTITITGVRPTTENGSIDSLYIVGVTREGITQNLSIEVNLTTTWTAPVAPVITTASLQGGMVGVYYNQTLTATGTAPITWDISSGALPGGVSLEADTGIISGTPTVAGTFNFTVRAANVAGNNEQPLAIGIATSPTVSPRGISMVRIPAGTFTMGSPATEIGHSDFEGPQRQVTLSAFYMGVFQVTQEQWVEVMTGNANGISTNPSLFSRNPAAGEIQGRRPVERVSWYDALVFANRLSDMEGLTPVYRINGSTNTDSWGAVPYLVWDGDENVWIEVGKEDWDAVEIVSNATGYRLPTEAQ